MKLVWSANLFTQKMMGLIATSDHRAQLSALATGGNNKVKIKFPLLVSPSGSICREAFDYLYDLSILGASESAKTLRTYAESLCHWLSYAERSNINWRRPTQRHFVHYRNSMKGQPTDDVLRTPNLKPRTINLRLTVAMEFGKFLGREHPHDSEEPEQSDCTTPSAQERAKPIKRQTILVKVSKARPRALTIEAIGALIGALGFPHRLAFQWQLCTGLRRGSVTALSLQHIDELTSLHSDGYISVPAKGGKLASSYVPNTLLTETIRYVETQRALVEPRSHSRLTSFRDRQAL
jgi:integrase